MAGQKKNILPNFRMPPQNLEAEMSVLGSLMLDGKTITQIVDILVPEDFYRENHEIIYSAIFDLFSQQAPIDLLSVANRLKEKKQLEKIGGNAYLTELVNSVPSASNVKYYAEIVRKKSILRHLIEAAGHINDLGFKEEEDLDYILDEAEQKVFNLAHLSLRQNFLTMKEAVSQAWERFEILNKSDRELRGVSTGFFELDKYLSGFQKSDLIILAARPSFGKTTLALDMARHISCENDVPVGIFSLEMASEQIVDKILAAEAHVDSWDMRTGGKKLPKEDFSRISDALNKISKAPLYIQDSSSLTALQIRAMARRLQSEVEHKHKKPLGLLIVDYIQMITPRRETESPVQQMTEISRALKNLAKELKIPVLAISQLNRSVEHRSPPTPRLSDLRESGSIEQDADVVLFIHREDKYKEDSDKKNIAEIIIAKHRNGPTGSVSLYFNPKKVNFTTIEKNDLNVF